MIKHNYNTMTKENNVLYCSLLDPSLAYEWNISAWIYSIKKVFSFILLHSRINASSICIYGAKSKEHHRNSLCFLINGILKDDQLRYYEASILTHVSKNSLYDS